MTPRARAKTALSRYGRHVMSSDRHLNRQQLIDEAKSRGVAVTARQFDRWYLRNQQQGSFAPLVLDLSVSHFPL